MKWPGSTHLFLEIELWQWKYHKHIPVLVEIILATILHQVAVLLSSVLMNGKVAEVYASRMMLLLLAAVSASVLSRCSSLLTMRLTTNSVDSCWVRWFCYISFARVIGYGSSKKLLFIFSFINSSGWINSSISVERMDSAFLGIFLTGWNLFRLELHFECINFFEKEGQRLLSRSSFGFKASLFLLLKFGDCSAISRVVVVVVLLVTIVTPHVGPLMILRRLAYTTDKSLWFLIIYW
jgi:hypothetical protein